tara:strand:+ start:3379 stop:3585 length:207 start_codon:yes stop_codon:yes gene_type:complete
MQNSLSPYRKDKTMNRQRDNFQSERRVVDGMFDSIFSSIRKNRKKREQDERQKKRLAREQKRKSPSKV